jgi:hypothetical protein
MSQFNRLQSLIEKKKRPKRGSLLAPNNERKFDSDTLLETLKEIEEKKDDKGSSSTNTNTNTGKGRKKTRKKKGKKRKTRKRLKSNKRN